MKRRMSVALAAFLALFGRSVLADPAFSPGFFWVINGPLDAAKMNAQLDQMVSNGCKSVCWHAYPKGFSSSFKTTMEPDYLTDGYLAVYSNVVDHAARLGMNFWFYDEGGWPSGSACGLVMKGTGDRFKKRYLRPGANGTNELFYATYEPEKWMPVPSTIEPGATERFIELTHERVKKYCGRHFGKTIRFAFTDEPIYPFPGAGRNLGWCSDFDAQFKSRKGYDLRPYVKAFVESDAPYATELREPLFEHRKACTVSDEIARVRIDYFDVMSNLFLERYLLPIRDWCRQNGLRSGGHFGGEDQVEGNALFGYAHILRDLRALDCPGVDVIWRQLWPTNALNLPFPRYAASTARQKGDPFVLSESFAVYGASLTPIEMKWLVDYQLVRGVNTFVFSSMSYFDAKKTTRVFGPETHTWTFQKPFFEYCAKTAEKLSEGRPDVDTAVLFDIRGLWAGGQYRADAADRHAEVARNLDRAHVDFDFVDDDQIAEATIAGGRLVVGKMSYATVVLPTYRWMLPFAEKKLAAFAQAGGRVIRGTDASNVPPTCVMSGKGHEDIRVTRRILADGQKRHFFVNEALEPRDVEVEGFGCHRFGPAESLFVDSGEKMPVGRSPRDRRVSGRLARGASPTVASPAVASPAVALIDWTPALGDWRVRKGEGFSGVETYQARFSHAGGKATLDLGRVCWYCKVKLNGEPLFAKGFPPYAWDVCLKSGENVLEVEVANTGANAAAAQRKKSAFSGYLDGFNAQNHESGLFGPVTIRSDVR